MSHQRDYSRPIAPFSCTCCFDQCSPRLYQLLENQQEDGSWYWVFCCLKVIFNFCSIVIKLFQFNNHIQTYLLDMIYKHNDNRRYVVSFLFKSGTHIISTSVIFIFDLRRFMPLFMPAPIHWFVWQMFIEILLCVRYSHWCWDCNCEQNRCCPFSHRTLLLESVGEDWHYWDNYWLSSVLSEK